jgi:Cu2+-exporting ATPase
MTEFKIEAIRQEGSEIDVCPIDVQELVQRKRPLGVIAMQSVNSTTVRISYDPKVIGARDLIEHHFGYSLALAPLQPDPGFAAGNQHVRHVGYMTLLSATLTIPVLVLAWAPIHERPLLYGSVSLALATLVQFIVAGPFYPTALKT